MRFLLSFFLLTSPLFGQLTWETRVIDLAASPKDNFAEGTFKFKNSGKYPVTILKTESSCGCTSAKLEKKVYAPGESGQVVQRYKIGWSRTPLHQTGLTVVTDDPSEPKTLIGMRVTVETIVQIDPEVLWWKLGEAVSARNANIKIVRSTPLNLISAETTTPGWKVKLITVIPGWEYQVQITPADLSKAQSAVFLIKPEVSPATPKPFQIRARVK